jgi:hypothetical protein
MKPSVFVRATFDSDATSLVGTFLPDETDDNDLDESQAARTRCSEFVKVRKVPATGEVEDVMTASSGASAKLGVKSIAHLSADHQASNALRVAYASVEKLEAEVDTKGLSDCCQAAPDQCSKRFISSVIMGDGRIFAATDVSNDVGADANGALHGAPVDAEVMYKDGLKWERKVSFKHQYFAFTVQRSMLGVSAETQAKNDAADASCAWANKVPKSLDGQYFVGISDPSPTEKIAHDFALRNAREQVIKYLGEFLSSSETSKQTVGGNSAALSAALDDQTTVTAISEGVARMVKDEKWCPAENIDTPKGQMKVVKVLALFPNEQRNAAAKLAITSLIDLKKKNGTLTPDAEKQLKSMIDAIK